MSPFHGLSLGGDTGPWTLHQRPPFPSRGFIKSGAALLVGATLAAPNPPPVTTVLTFSTDELAVRLARMVIFDNWGGSPSLKFYLRARGAVLEEYAEQLCHDYEGSAWVFRLDALCPPYSQIEISCRNDTDTGNDRGLDIYVTGWLEPWPESRVPPDTLRRR